MKINRLLKFLSILSFLYHPSQRAGNCFRFRIGSRVSTVLKAEKGKRKTKDRKGEIVYSTREIEHFLDRVSRC